MEIQIFNISLIKPNEMFTSICKYIIFYHLSTW